MGATYFFRDLHTLKMIYSVIIPEIERKNNLLSESKEKKAILSGNYGSEDNLFYENMQVGREINIWSAGCANGSEPYTLAILLNDIFNERTFSKINIYATDIDPNNKFEDIIRRGSYPAEAVKKIPAGMFENSLRPDPALKDNYIISDRIKNQVRYINHDLLTLKPVTDKQFDIIVCKNVLLHFTEEQRVDVINMFYNSLAESGFLITEQTQKFPEKLSSKFERIVSNARIYRKIKGN